ncbi:MAG: DoxX family protein [Chloroflexi bacterium]|nr:DoxX family protein [Chloroflexota bacterium]
MSVDLGLLVLRVAVGLILFGHGAQKLFGWFGGPGLAAATAMFGGHLRLRPAPFWVLVGSLSEVVGGLLLVAGLFGPAGAVAVVAAMLVAITVHWPAFWAQQGGIEYPLVLLVVALTLAIVGPGAYSLDSVLGLQLQTPLIVLGGLAVAVVGVGLALGTRAPATPSAQEAVARS